MKRLIVTTVTLLALSTTISQQSINLSGKVFRQVDKLPSTSELVFKSNTEVRYVITSVIGGKTYIDNCPGKATVKGRNVSIRCICEDKEIYPDPITDSFSYDPKTQNLTSTSWRSSDGVYWVWKKR